MSINYLSNLVLLLVIVVCTGIQSEGGKISQVDIRITSTIELSGNLSEVLMINGGLFFVTTEIPSGLKNPFVNDGFLYFEII